MVGRVNRSETRQFAYYYHNDHLGTPQKMTDASVTVVWAAAYKPFGEAAIDTQVTTITNNLRFPGQYYDAETGLHYNYYRDYNPVIGRYVEADPIGIQKGENHLFAYVDNNPVNFIDLIGNSKGGKKSLNTEGFTKKSNLEAVEKALKEAEALKQCKRIKALRALKKVIQRGGYMGILIDLILDQIIDEMTNEDKSCPNPYDPSCYAT